MVSVLRKGFEKVKKCQQFVGRIISRPWSDETFYKESGMTLIEIIIVVALLGTLMTYLVTNLTDRAESAKQDQSKIAMGQIAQSLEMYKIHTGKYPDSLQELLSNTTNNPKWRGPYTEPNKLKDPWDQDFSYSKDGRKYKIISPSSDGQIGTSDDVVYPEGSSEGGGEAPASN